MSRPRTLFFVHHSTPLHIQRERYLLAVEAMVQRKLTASEEMFSRRAFEDDYSVEETANAIAMEKRASEHN